MKKLSLYFFLYIFFALIFSSSVFAISPCKGDNKRSLFKPLKWHKCIGIEKVDNGKYEGEYRFGKFDGHGTFIWSDDRKYIGKWKKGKKIGFTYTFDFHAEKKTLEKRIRISLQQTRAKPSS